MSDTLSSRWSVQQAHAWFDAQPRPLGANFIPATAVNQLEMWQAETFDIERIDLELGWAEALGMNVMRVFLHNMVWEADAAGLRERIERYLEVADRHGIKTMLVLFDSCWDPHPKTGPQRPPQPGVHNSAWVQGPSATQLADPSCYPLLRRYVEDIVGAFGQDPRVWCWDLWNEPDNQGGGLGHYLPFEAKGKLDLVAELLPQVFDWARAVQPMQPLTSGVWDGDDWSPDSTALNRIQRTQLGQSDILSFHDYSASDKLERRMKQMLAHGRPVVCTEYLARGMGSNFSHALALARRERVGMINWGFVSGKSQTHMPWDSWKNPYTVAPPTVWFHDILHPDGRPYCLREVELLRQHRSGD